MTQLTIATNTIFATGGPFALLAGSTMIVNFNFLGSGSLTTATNKLYRNKNDVSVTKLSSLNATIAGRVVTSALATLDDPGDYQLELQVVDGSVTRKKAIRIFVLKNGVYQ